MLELKKYGHCANECWFGKAKGKKRDEEEVCNAQGDSSDSDTILLMATTTDVCGQESSWFRDIGCSNHLTSHKEWLVDRHVKKEQDKVWR